MDVEQLKFSEKLELQWFFEILPKSIRALIEDRYHIEGDTLVITCESQKEAWQFMSKVQIAIFLTVREYPSTFKLCSYRWADGRFNSSLVPVDRTGLRESPRQKRRSDRNRKTLKDFK